jgi:hypothetical protein
MGLAWVCDDTGEIGAVAPPEPGGDWMTGPRHRRPTLLARGGQAVACRITALARTTPDLATPLTARLQRRPAMPARRYWT